MRRRQAHTRMGRFGWALQAAGEAGALPAPSGNAIQAVTCRRPNADGRSHLRHLTSTGLLVLALVSGSLLLMSPWRSVSSHRAAGSLSGAAALRRLQALPLEGQSVISRALGAPQVSFQARRTSSGYRLAGGNIEAQLGRAGVRMSTGRGSLSIALTGIGRDGRLLTIPATTSPHADANRVTFDHAGVAEWYVAGPLGIEQGFTLAHRPTGHDGPATLALGLGGSLHAVHSGSQLDFLGPTGRTVLRYGGLSAYDARGRRLRAWLTLSGKRLLIHVADADARYPLRIDPLIQQGPLLTAAGGFGASVAVSSDGNTALIGDDGSAAQIFTRSGSTWTQQAELTGAGDSANGEFGDSVALSANGETALVGDPADNGHVGAAWVFTRSDSTWTQQAELTGAGETGEGEFGNSVALSADGSTALIGGWSNYDEAGAAWVFTRSGSSWSQQGAKIFANDESEYERSFFGASVALSANGNTALIGGWGDSDDQGAAWVFTRSGSTWTQQGNKLMVGGNKGWFGYSVALSEDGNTALIGAPQATEYGAAWVFTRSGSTWTQQSGKLTVIVTGVDYSALGYSVALSADGNTALIGAPSGNYENNGTAWVFIRTGSTWTRQEAPVRGKPTQEAGSRFGSSVALSADATTAMVGGAGAAWAEIASPQIASPPDVSFGSQPIGHPSSVLWIEVKNTGEAPLAPLTFSAAAQITGANRSDFAIPSGEDLCDGATVMPGETCRIGVLFTPTATGARSANLSLGASNAPETPTVELSGTGVGPSPAFTISPNPGATGALVSFDGADSSDTDGSIESYAWSFGDGTSGEGVAPTHTYTEPGTYTVTMTVTGSGGLSAKVTHSVTVEKAQSIEFTSNPPSPAVTGSTYRLSAKATSGLEVSFSSGTPSVCSVTGPTVEFIGSGVCLLVADQAGDSEYAAATPAQQSIGVQRSQTITFSSSPPRPANLGADAYSVHATASSGLPVSFSSGTPSVCSVTAFDRELCRRGDMHNRR